MYLQGCDTFTISPATSSKLFNFSNTIDAAADFELAAKRNGSSTDGEGLLATAATASKP